MRRFFLILCMISSICVWFQPANSTTIANGDFASGLSDWTLDNPDALPAGIMPVDMDGPGPLNASDAFFVQTGGGYGSSSVSIFQPVEIIYNGAYTLSADIAASYFPTDTIFISNLSAGVITIAWDGVIIDSFDFGEIVANSWEYATLSASFVAASSGILEIGFFRPFASDINSPMNYLANVSLVSNDAVVASIPEPATVLLVGTGIVGIASFARRKLKQLQTAN